MNAETVTHLVAICISFGVGLPLVARAVRGRDWPAVLLGAALVFDGLEWLSWGIAVSAPVRDTPAADALAIVCRLSISAATVCIVAFTVVVFRRDSRAARAFGLALCAALLVGFLGSGAVGDWGGWRPDHPWVWLELGAQMLAYAWATAEPLAYYAKLHRRAALGLTSPLVAHRFLLWGAYAGMFFLTQIGYMLQFVLSETPAGLGLVLTWITISGEVALWLAFFPPRRYARWIESRASGTGEPDAAHAAVAPEIRPEFERGSGS